MSWLLAGITNALGQLFGNLWGNLTPVLTETDGESPEDIGNNYETADEEPEVESDEESDYETADEDDEEEKIIFRRIEDLAPKRLVETRRISDQALCVDYLAIIPETYLYREDPLAMFEDIEDQISDVYRRELARLGGIKTKIILIAHMNRFVQGDGGNNYQIDQNIAFPSEILDIIRQDRIDQTISRQYNEILDKIDEMERNQHSGWIYEYGKKIFLEISAYQPLRGRSHFTLPEIWNKPQLGIINPQNTDNRCFEVCMKAHQASEEARRQGRRARNLHDVSRLKHYDNILDFSGIDFPVTLKDIDKFEENNPKYAVNVFYPVSPNDDKEPVTRMLDPLRISEYNYQRENMVDLILFTEGEEDLRDRHNINDIPEGLNTHYCLINGENGWNRIMRNWNKHKERKYFCRHCMIAPFSRKDLLEEHIKHNCHGRNNPNAGQREIFPRKGGHIMNFRNYNAMENVPFYFVKDLEADSDPVENNVNNESTVKLQKQKPNSYGYALIQTDGKLVKEVIRRTPNSIAESWKSIQRDLEEIIKPKLRNPEKIIMTEHDWQRHKSAKTCYICEEMLQETRYNKVKYFSSSGNFMGGAHYGCVKIKCETTEESLTEATYRTEGLSIDEENTFKKETKCCLCKMSLRANINVNRVKDHDHFTGKYRGPAHRGCNLQLRIKPDEIKIPLIYHGGKHYDFHHEVRELGLVNEDKIEIIADNMENYKTLIIGQIKFIDSCQFQFPSLEKVASNLRGQKKSPEQLVKCFPIMAQSIPLHLLPLLTQKSEYPYELNDPERFSRTELPSRKEFNTVLGELNYCDRGCEKKDCEHEKIYTISQKQYSHAQKVWEEAKCKTFGDYHDLYLRTDVLILADSIQRFRITMKEVSGLDPLNYITLPSFAFDMAKKMTKVKLELFHEGQEDMHEFIQRWMRGGNSMAPRRLAKANFPGMKGYNKHKANKWLLYLDANNLYGWAMSQYLPTGGFRWLDIKNLPDIQSISPTAKRGSAWEVKLKYPAKLHPSHSDYPLCPERRVVKRNELSPYQNNDLIDRLSGGKFAETEKLVASLEAKDRYIIHYRNLQQCLDLGMELEHVYRVLEFDQSPWLEPYITANTIRRRNAKNAFEKDLWKLMNNAVFGKTMEDVRRRTRVDLVRPIGEEHRLRKMLADPALVGRKIFHGSNLIAVHRKQTNVVLNKPIYVGASILDLSKYYMYDFWYNHIKHKYGDRAKLCYTDTDSLIIEIETEDVYADMVEDAELYDFSDYPKDHPLLEKLPPDQWIILPDGTHELKNKKVIGKWKDEFAGTRALRYAGNRSKSYALETEDEYKNVQKAKGLKKSLVKKELTIDIYERCILEGIEDEPRTANFLRCERFVPYIIRQTKRSINPLDSKRWILNDRVTTWAIGDCRIPGYLSALKQYGNNIPQEILIDLGL